MKTLEEKIWRCDCGCGAVGVSFYRWPDDAHEWFIEVYKLGGVNDWRWRFKKAFSMMLGRDVYVESVSLDESKARELFSFLQDNIDS